MFEIHYGEGECHDSWSPQKHHPNFCLQKQSKVLFLLSIMSFEVSETRSLKCSCTSSRLSLHPFFGQFLSSDFALCFPMANAIKEEEGIERYGRKPISLIILRYPPEIDVPDTDVGCPPEPDSGKGNVLLISLLSYLDNICSSRFKSHFAILFMAVNLAWVILPKQQRSDCGT
ncbi:hypothetical protein FF38_00295 [Lucilia cuprina]|uniref:Uncharacterized protein n=1 Tax=Lucilia cuprina TaxID=7375 RepID=A0A0L0BLE8_LUCCU|nr:hypothetical protein FF38_00295 [Lucilia cuprina]